MSTNENLAKGVVEVEGYRVFHGVQPTTVWEWSDGKPPMRGAILMTTDHDELLVLVDLLHTGDMHAQQAVLAAIQAKPREGLIVCYDWKAKAPYTKRLYA